MDIIVKKIINVDEEFNSNIEMWNGLG